MLIQQTSEWWLEGVIIQILHCEKVNDWSIINWEKKKSSILNQNWNHLVCNSCRFSSFFLCFFLRQTSLKNDSTLQFTMTKMLKHWRWVISLTQKSCWGKISLRWNLRFLSAILQRMQSKKYNLNHRYKHFIGHLQRIELSLYIHSTGTLIGQSLHTSDTGRKVTWQVERGQNLSQPTGCPQLNRSLASNWLIMHQAAMLCDLHGK